MWVGEPGIDRLSHGMGSRVRGVSILSLVHISSHFCVFYASANVVAGGIMFPVFVRPCVHPEQTLLA